MSSPSTSAVASSSSSPYNLSPPTRAAYASGSTSPQREALASSVGDLDLDFSLDLTPSAFAADSDAVDDEAEADEALSRSGDTDAPTSDGETDGLSSFAGDDEDGERESGLMTPPSTAPSLFSVARSSYKPSALNGGGAAQATRHANAPSHAQARSHAARTAQPHTTTSEEDDGSDLGIDLPATLAHAHALLQAEAKALLDAAQRLGERPKQFQQAVRVIVDCIAGGGKIVWTGVGKSGIIARKLHATSLSLGLASAFLCPIGALHGDLGALSGHFPLSPRAPLLRARAAEHRAPPAPLPDVVCALSHSGESAELLQLLPHVRARGCATIAFTSKSESSLGRFAREHGAWVDCRTSSPVVDSLGLAMPNAAAATSHCACCALTGAHSPGTSSPVDTSAEADGLVPAPTSSTTVALAMGDALVLSIARACGLGVQSFKQNHPGGSLGVSLARPLVR